MPIDYKCIGTNKDGSNCSVSAKRGLYCKRHEPKKTLLVLKQNKDGSLSKRNKTVIKRINYFMRRRRRFDVSFDGVEYGVHHSGQMYAKEKKNQGGQRYRHIGDLLKEGK